jgi:hypothetical protein
VADLRAKLAETADRAAIGGGKRSASNG